MSQNQLVNCHWLRTELEIGVKKISSTPIRDHAHTLCAFTGSWENFPGTTLLHMHVAEKQEERRSCSPTQAAQWLQVRLFWKSQLNVSFRMSKLLAAQIFLLCLFVDSCISKLRLFFSVHICRVLEQQQKNTWSFKHERTFYFWFWNRDKENFSSIS